MCVRPPWPTATVSTVSCLTHVDTCTPSCFEIVKYPEQYFTRFFPSPHLQPGAHQFRAFLLLSSVAKISELELASSQAAARDRDRPTRTRAATHGLHEDRDIVTIMLLLLLGAVAYEEDWDRGSLVQKLDASQMQTAIMKHDKVRTID
jgi:hypothetical protein